MTDASSRDAFVIGGGDSTYLTVAEAARTLDIPRRAIERDIADGNISTILRKDGVRGIDLLELQRVYIDGEERAPAATDMSAPVPSMTRVGELEAELMESREQVEVLTQQLTEMEETVDLQRLELGRLNTKLSYGGDGSRREGDSSPRSASRRKRRRAKRLRRRTLAIAGVFILAIAVTGIVVGLIYVFDQSNQRVEAMQSAPR